MKKSFLFLFCLITILSSCSRKFEPLSKGGFETRSYRNVFLEMGYSQAEIEAKLDSVFYDVFEGPDKVYFEVGDDMGYMSDIKNHDARSEGMSYGMMIAVQLDKKDIFDRLWRWSKTYMQHQDGPYKGYFRWSMNYDGTPRANNPASDGELYYVTSLIFASNRWGNDTGIDYLAEAQNILNCSWEKDGSEGTYPFIDKEHKLINFVPDRSGSQYTDPSYHLPAFFEVWARWADDGRADFYKECAQKSREYLHASINPENGLNPDYNNFDGSSYDRGRPTAFRYDSWRVPMNIALDYSWACADKEWQTNYANTVQGFFYSKGIDDFVDQYNLDGTEADHPYSGKLRHSVGLVSALAAATLASDNENNKEFVDRLWNSKNVPFEDGYFDAYFDGLLRLFAFMHLSGNYQVIFPAN
ncbi:MAG: glycoside hydrolase [Bacteroidales bacterium]|nr:glycoside hydrolase [Bacteroidales bacterium]